MIETRIPPVHRAVANLAGLRYSRLQMVRIGGVLVILQVAGHAILIGQFVVPIDMALRARRGGMRPSEREPGVGVVETGVSP